MMLLISIAWADSAAALASLIGGQPRTARRLAEEALASNPDDFVAHYVVGEVYWETDGNLPRALYHHRLADTLYKRDQATLGDEAWRTHFYVLKNMRRIANDMEQWDLALSIAAEFNVLYKPKLEAELGWTLMKQGRLDEARAVAVKALDSDDDWQATLGYGVLCTLESKSRDRRASADACNMTLTFAKAAGQDTTVDHFNAGLAMLSALDFEEAEKLYRASSRDTVGYSANPWIPLTELLLLEGRGFDAAKGLKEMQRWRFAQEPAEKAQTRSTADATLALVLLVAGESDKASQLIDRVLRTPDRRASTSTSHEVSRSRHTLLGGAIRRLAAERAAEAASMEWLPTRMVAWMGSWWPDVAAWRDAVTLGGLHADRDLLLRSLAPYDEDGGVPAPWMAGDLIPMLGAGVVQAAIDEARPLEEYPGLAAYYDALDTEVAWSRGASNTLELAAQALRDLPEQEVLLRARIAALAADHAYRHRDPSAMGYYERALQLDPSSMRRLGLRLPAVVQGGGRVATMLGRSPRLQHDNQGFVIQVQGDQVCIVSPQGSRLGCHQGAGVGDEEERARSTVQAFYDGAFSLPLGLSRVDMDSLDGTTRLGTEAKKKALEQVLKGL